MGLFVDLLVSMRVVIQKVRFSSVTVAETVVGAIDHGLLILLGITHDDNTDDIAWLIRKITRLRIFEDEQGKMNRSVVDVEGGILVVSQFTLYADCRKGNRPSFIRSAPPDISIPLYEQFVATLKAEFDGPVATGEFGAMMDVQLLNEGPVTIILDSKENR